MSKKCEVCGYDDTSLNHVNKCPSLGWVEEATSDSSKYAAYRRKEEYAGYPTLKVVDIDPFNEDQEALENNVVQNMYDVDMIRGYGLLLLEWADVAERMLGDGLVK